MNFLLIKQSCLLVLLNITAIINLSNAANIFCIFPMASFSHQQPMLALSRALAAKGHNLTVITTDPSKVPIKNHREIDMSFLYEEFRRMEEKVGLKVERVDAVQVITAGPPIMEYYTPVILRSPQIQNLIREVNGTKYDLVIYEPMFHGYLIAFADIIGNPPIIGIQTFDPPFVILDEVGIPLMPSYVPDKFLPYDDHMTIWQRIYNLYIIGYYYFTFNYYIRPFTEAMVQKYFGKLKYSVKEMEYNKSLYIVSTDHSTEYPRPNQPNTVFVGPMHLSKVPEPLPIDLQKWMDEAEDGVIYFSLGGNMQGTALPEDIRNSFIKAFEQFPKMRILWKWEAETELPGQPDNVLIKKWLPQQSVLAHSKCKLFISQVGLQSFQEAIHFGVPMLGVPIFADQDFNTRKLILSGGGLGMEFFNITSQLVYENLKQLLTNSSYEENMKRLSTISSDRSMSPIDTAVWWVEYVLRHNGASHLRPASLDLNWYQIYMLDILLVVLIFIVVISSVVYFISVKIFSFKKFIKLKTN